MTKRRCTNCRVAIRSHVWVVDNRDYCGPFCDPERVVERREKKKEKRKPESIDTHSAR